MSGLGETLERLSELLPARIQIEKTHWAIWQANRRHLNLLEGEIPDWLLEYALREECETRDWPWVAQQFMKKWHPERGCKALVYVPGLPDDGWGNPRDFVEAEADTPAHALALALLAALGDPAAAQAGAGEVSR